MAAPLVFGKLIESGSRQSIFGGYVFAALLMFAAAFLWAIIGVVVSTGLADLCPSEAKVVKIVRPFAARNLSLTS